MSEISGTPVYLDPQLTDDFEAPEFWCGRIGKIEFASAGVVRITFATTKMGHLYPACSVLIPVENLPRSIDLLNSAAQQIAQRSFIYTECNERRAAH